MDTGEEVRGQQQQQQEQEQEQPPPTANLLRTVAARLVGAVFAPFEAAAQAAKHSAKQSASPVLHLALLSILIPFLGISSFGAGLIINSWIPTGWKEQIYLQYGDVGRAPYAEVMLPELSSSHPYDISLQLVLPHFAKNAELGNFMSSIAIKTPPNITLGYATRPSLIFPPSLYLSPFILSGLRSTQTHEVELLKGFYASPSFYASRLSALVTVGRSDSWKGIGDGHGREVVIVDAFIKGVPRLRGLQAFFARYPLILLFITTTTFFISSTVVTIAIYIYLSPRIHLFNPPPPLEGGEPRGGVKREEEQPFDPLGTIIKEEEEEEGEEEGESGEGEGEESSGLLVAESPLSRTSQEDEESDVSVAGH